MEAPVELIVGLGNPGPNYQRTRHNAGADLVLELAKSLSVELKHESKFFGDTAKTIIANRTVRLLIPSTFMNLSGKSIGALAKFYQIAPENILIVHDELDLAPGTARFKKGGGHGGHNGLRDLHRVLGSDYARIRIGIGHPGHKSKVHGYVLSKASNEQRDKIAEAIDHTLAFINDIVRSDWDRAMNILHQR